MKNIKILISLCFFISLINHVFAAKVDTVETYSAVMKKSIKAVVITPHNYNSIKEIPVVYLLHGYGGKYSSWINSTISLTDLADVHQVLIVCPDGGFNSWYWDSAVDEKSQYETYVSKELVQWVDAKYKTIKDRKGRAITGLSMGGHGALYLAFKHQDIYGAAGSMSGGVDIRPFPNNWDMSKRLGDYAKEPKRWEENTVINMIHLLKPNSLSLLIDCGTADFFMEVNKQLHEQLLYRNIPHDFIVRPGAHNWDYWNNAVKYQLLFMSNYFKKSN